MKIILGILLFLSPSAFAIEAGSLELRNLRLKCFEKVRSKSNAENIVAPTSKNADEMFPLTTLKRELEIYKKNGRNQDPKAIEYLSKIVKNAGNYYQCDDAYNPLPTPKEGALSSQSSAFLKYRYMCLPTTDGIQKIPIEQMQKFVSYLKDLNVVQKSYASPQGKLANFLEMQSFFAESTEKLFASTYATFKGSIESKEVDIFDEKRIEKAAYASYLQLKPGTLNMYERNDCGFDPVKPMEKPVQVINGRSFQRTRPGSK